MQFAYLQQCSITIRNWWKNLAHETYMHVKLLSDFICRAGSKKKGAASTAALLIIAADCFLDKSSGLLLTHKSSVDVDACLFCRRLP